jgi:hypothetical protein
MAAVGMQIGSAGEGSLPKPAVPRLQAISGRVLRIDSSRRRSGAVKGILKINFPGFMKMFTSRIATSV